MLLWLAMTAVAEPVREERLVELRAAVESERASLRLERADLEARLSSLHTAQSDVEMDIEQQRLSMLRLDKAIAELAASVEQEPEAMDPLKGVLSGALVDLRDVVASGPPFRRDERSGALDELSMKLATLPVDKVAAQLWQFVEDELAIRKENAVDRQVIVLNGEERLAQVARLGLVALYYRTDDGDVGFANSDGTFVEASGSDAVQVEALFEQLERRVRTGWVDVPGLPEGAP